MLLAVNSIIHSKTFDNGMICASEQSVTVIDTIYDVDKAEHLVLAGGPGHTASLYVHPAQAEKISLFEHVMKACRIVIKTPSPRTLG